MKGMTETQAVPLIYCDKCKSFDCKCKKKGTKSMRYCDCVVKFQFPPPYYRKDGKKVCSICDKERK